MSAKVMLPGALILSCLCAAPARAAEPASTPYGGSQAKPMPSAEPQPLPHVIAPATPGPNAPLPAVTQAPGLPPGSVCSPWTGPGGTGCCGPVGGNGPIQSELFLRNGITLPVAGGIFNNTLNSGYVFSAGARSMFFNPVGSAAWTIEYGIDYYYNNGNHPEMEFDIFGTFVNIREYHRAAVHLALGREIFLFTPAFQPGSNFRIGLDAGGRYGYSRVNFNLPDSENQRNEPTNLTRRADVYGGVLVAIHADLELPINSCLTLIGGLRGEWAYNFTDIIPTWDTDLQDVAIMWNLGVRY